MSKNKKSILYIGNDLFHLTNYMTSMETLSRLFIKDNYIVYKSSAKKNELARMIDMLWTIIRLRNKVDYILIDTFSTKSFYYCFFASFLSKKLNIPYIPILRGGNLPERLKKNPKLSKRIFSHSHVNVAPSHYLFEAFQKFNFKTIFIPNIIEISKYKFKERNEPKPSILWVRAFRELYNPTMAIEVLKLIKKEFHEAKLCMVGPVKDHSFEETKNKANEYNLLQSVEFTGVLSKEDWIKKAEDFDLFINTTNFDNTPVSVIEAMALGLTIVSTNAGGMPYLIENKLNGILVDKNDATSMAASIIEIIKKKQIDLSVNARNTAEEFSWEVVKHQWYKLLK